MGKDKAKRNPKMFKEELENVHRSAKELIHSNSTDENSVVIQDFFDLGDLSYYSAVHMKVTRLKSLVIEEDVDLNKLSKSIYDAINFLSFWGADVRLRMKEEQETKVHIDVAGNVHLYSNHEQQEDFWNRNSTCTGFTQQVGD